MLEVQEKNIYRTADATTLINYKNAFRILFCGDYISEADFSIGVFEGPLGGNARLYSQSNYGDGKGLYINFPDAFADAVKNAGFDLVTTANNHILDMGLDGVKRTIAVLKKKNINFIGSYESAEDKENSRVKVVEKNGIKMAFLAYTYGANNFSIEKLRSEEFSHVTTVAAWRNEEEFERVLDGIKEDFARAKSYKPDLIIVLPHWGAQFTDEPNDYQKFLRDIFFLLGADIILGCHTHSVQPAKIETINGRKTYTLYCPGNYANVYREDDGDASLMAEIYIDRGTKFVFIAPWTSTDGDKISALKYQAKINLNNKYTEALKNWCATTGDIFINPNFNIKAVLNRRPHKDYLNDWIHPNASKGVVLYSEAVLKA